MVPLRKLGLPLYLEVIHGLISLSEELFYQLGLRQFIGVQSPSRKILDVKKRFTEEQIIGFSRVFPHQSIAARNRT